MPDTSDHRRREFIRALGAGAVTLSAATTGCLHGEDEADDGAEEGEADGGSADGETTPTVEPAEFPADAECPVCGMASAEHPDWNAQVLHEDGERAYLCTSGCMTAYKAYSGSFAVSDADIAGVWVTGFDSKELVDGFEASYALESDPERVDDPMMVNPASFAERADAVAYVDEVDHLTEDDVVGYEDLDREVAESYRGQLIEEA